MFSKQLNDRYWSPINPLDDVPCKEQGMAKAMCWVGMLDGQIIGPIWVEGSMDQFVYKEMLEEHVLPLIKTREEYGSRKMAPPAIPPP